ncbi:MAG TPA: glycosyltransferase family 39 protein [Candidatus Binataceae bacterium]|nr:glycosyltransferase family 39 protein [Candidatus Binataceae bacterium]
MASQGEGLAAADSPTKLSRRQLEILAATFAVSAALYTYRLGQGALGASEAYSAAFAAKPDVRAILHIPLAQGSAGTVLYYVALHSFALLFGTSEFALRGFSVIFALIALAFVFAIGRAMFGNDSALAGAAVWAFNPLAVVFAHSARMYSMFMAIALGHFLLVWRLRKNPSIALSAACGFLGAAMLYTHMAGVLVLAAEAAMLARDAVRGRLNPMAWVAIGLAGALFAPFLPTALSLSQALVNSQWLGWIGSAAGAPLLVKALVICAAGTAALWIILGKNFEGPDRIEPIRWLLGWSLIPAGLMLAGSIVLRPMFNARYVAPAGCTLAILAAHGLGLYSEKIRNLLALGLTTAFIILFKFDLAPAQPWREFAAQVAADPTARDPIFFESGFVFRGAADGSYNPGFPFGYYSVPFNYYFHGPNPQVALPGYDPVAARRTIESLVPQADGGWLVSWKDTENVQAELPDPGRFKTEEIFHAPDLAIFRITPSPSAQRAGTAGK